MASSVLVNVVAAIIPLCATVTVAAAVGATRPTWSAAARTVAVAASGCAAGMAGGVSLPGAAARWFASADAAVAERWIVGLATPLGEEVGKALPLLLLAAIGRLRGPRDGLLLGAAIAGVFAALESWVYGIQAREQLSTTGWLHSLLSRGLYGTVIHFGCTVGLGWILGVAQRSDRWWVIVATPSLALTGAVGLHAGWNLAVAASVRGASGAFAATQLVAWMALFVWVYAVWRVNRPAARGPSSQAVGRGGGLGETASEHPPTGPSTARPTGGPG